MAKPFSNDLRLRLVESVRSGVSRRQTAALFQVSVSRVIKLMQKVDATGEVAPTRFGGFKTSPLVEHESDIRGWVAEQPEIMLAELRLKLLEAGTSSSSSAIARFLTRLGLTRKKRRRSPPNEVVKILPRRATNGLSGKSR